jgi:hypothetical protein
MAAMNTPFDENRMAHATQTINGSPGLGWRAELRMTVGGVRLISEDQDAERFGRLGTQQERRL